MKRSFCLWFLDGGNHGLPCLVNDGSEGVSTSRHSEPGVIKEGHERLVIFGLGCQLLIEKALLKLKLLAQKHLLKLKVEKHADERTKRGTGNP